MNRPWKVTMELCRETWSGHEQRDNSAHIEIVRAASKKTAENKGKRQAIDPPKGRQWSHYIWARNVQAEPITAKEERGIRSEWRAWTKAGKLRLRKPPKCVRRR